MIFVTVGTHEQPFNRLVEKIDSMVGNGIISEEVIIQKGYSTYVPKNCKCYDLIPWEEMQKLNKEARIIITHGGPASFIDVLSLGKTPIVVPRQAKFNEHVNDHQLEFSKQLVERGENMIVVENIDDLDNVILNFEESNNKFLSNNENFCNIVNELIIKILG